MYQTKPKISALHRDICRICTNNSLLNFGFFTTQNSSEGPKPETLVRDHNIRESQHDPSLTQR